MAGGEIKRPSSEESRAANRRLWDVWTEIHEHAPDGTTGQLPLFFDLRATRPG